MPRTSDARDRMILSAALMLRERGVAGTSIVRVLEDSGAPRGSVTHHFPGGKREMLLEAIALAGATATAIMRTAVERGGSPPEILAAVVGFYRRALRDTACAAGCPVGAVASEAHDDEALAAAARDVFAAWRSLLAGALEADGHPVDEAVELADLCIAAVEGALLLARVERSTAPLDRVEHALTGLVA